MACGLDLSKDFCKDASMLRTIVVAGAAAILGSLILSVPVSAQNGTRITFSDSSAPISQVTQPAGQALVNTRPIAFATGERVDAANGNGYRFHGGNQCEAVSAAPGGDSCEAGATKKTVVAVHPIRTQIRLTSEMS